MYSLHHSAYCGMSYTALDQAELSDARREAAERIRRYRRRGFKVALLARGRDWEILEPENCAMVPDACGTLYIRHDTFECRECGSACETRDAALECCAECYA